MTTALLPKELPGDTRSIGLLQLLPRIWLCIRKLSDTRDWFKERASFYDHALAGSSALRSALLQALRIELAEAEGLEWCLLLLDLQEFYDTIAISLL